MLKTSVKYVLGLMLLAGLAANQARAVDELPQPFVVLVGINQYNDPQIKSRKFAEADAKALYDLFVDKNRLGVNPNRIKLLLGNPDATRPSEPATKENILKAVTWVEKFSGPNDVVIFAFIGEGSPPRRSVPATSPSIPPSRTGPRTPWPPPTSNSTSTS